MHKQKLLVWVKKKPLLPFRPDLHKMGYPLSIAHQPFTMMLKNDHCFFAVPDKQLKQKTDGVPSSMVGGPRWAWWMADCAGMVQNHCWPMCDKWHGQWAFGTIEEKNT